MQGRQRALALLLAACAGAALCGCSFGWRPLAPEGAGFSVSIPSEVACADRLRKVEGVARWPVRRCESVDQIRHRFLLFGREFVWYHVEWSRVPEELAREDLKGLLERLGEPVRGKTVSSFRDRLALEGQEEPEEIRTEVERGPAALAGEPAEEFHGTTVGASRGIVVRRLVCLHRGMLYEIQVVGEEGPALERTWRGMWDSFEFADAS